MRIYAAVDWLAPDEEPVELARALASAAGAPVTVVSVFAFQQLASRVEESTYGAALRADAEPVVERLAAALRAHGVEAESEAIGAASVRHGLQELSERADAGLLVVGSTTRGVAGRILGGTTATALLHGAGCAVAVPPRSYRSPGGAPLTVGVGFDGSVDAEVALADAAAFAKATGARLRVLAAADFSTWVEPVGFTAFDYSEIMRDQLRFLERTLQHAVDAVPDDVAVEPVVREGDAATVLREASDDLDLLVCGSRGYGAVRGALLGSVTRRLVQSGGCPVVVVPRAGGSEGRSLAGLVAASAPSLPT